MTHWQNEEDLDLGEDVTEAVKARTQGASAVLSIRLGRNEITELEVLGRSSGKSLSDVARDAIRTYVQMKRTVPLVARDGFNYGMPEMQWNRSSIVATRTPKSNPDNASTIGEMTSEL